MKDTREVVILNLDDILPNRFQPRIKFDEKAIVELSESIKEHGVIQPIIVRKISDKFEIIAGERRYKASVIAGKTTIPAIVVDLDDKDSSEIALIENVQRQDLTPIEEAISYRKILDMGYLTQEELATKLGVAQPTIANKLRLLNLDDDVQDALLEEKISERHARSLLKLQSSSKQKEMLQRIINERLTVRKTDEEIEKMKNNNEQMSTFDSLANNINSYSNDIVQNQPLDNNINPFQLNNEVVVENPSIPNEEPVNIVPENIEVLDFNDFDVNNSFNNFQQFDNDIPSMPIVEDVQVQEMPSEELVSSFSTPFDDNMSNQDNIETTTEPIMQSSNIENEQTFIQSSEEESNELRPNRFFNILNTEDTDESDEVVQINKEENSQNSFAEPIESFNIFNSGYENHSDNLNQSQSVEFQPIKIEEETPDFNDNINNSMPDLSSSEDTSTELVYNNVENYVDQKMNLRDVINMIRNCADTIEKNNFEIDCEEFDFDDIYQIIFKIKK